MLQPYSTPPSKVAFGPTQLSTMMMELHDELQALLLLSSLQKNWETLVVLLSNLALGISQVTSSLLNEETKRKDSKQSQVLVIENRGSSTSCNHSR